MKLRDRIIKPLSLCIAVYGVISSSAVFASDEGWFDEIDFSYNGFFRAESAYATGEENPYNQGGNTFNDRSISRQAYLPPALNPASGPLTGLLGSGALGAWGTVPLPGVSDTVRRGDFIDTTDNDFNYTVLRAEVEFTAALTY